MLTRELLSGQWEVDLLKDIFSNLHDNGPVNPSHLETLALMKFSNPQNFHSHESKLLYMMGLFYKTTEPQSFVELVYSLYAESIQQDTGRRFTPIQADAYKAIRKFNNFSFSAPTSTGKSYIFQEIIKDVQGDVIIVVPSRALLSEYILKIKAITPKDILVLPFIELVNTSKTNRRIYIITPERGDDLFNKIDLLNIELILFDEAQLTEQDIRGMKFDSFVKRVDRRIPNAKKVFTHPFISNPEAQLVKHGLDENSSATSYKQNNVGKIYLTHKGGNFKFFSPYEDRAQGIAYSGDIIQGLFMQIKLANQKDFFFLWNSYVMVQCVISTLMIMKKLIFIFLVMGGAMFCTPTKASAQAEYTYSVTVVDELGLPIPGVL